MKQGKYAITNTPDADKPENKDERVWFITGASSGLGCAMAKAALSHGDCVMATARDKAAIEQLAETGSTRLALAYLDVTDLYSISSAVDATLEAFGHIDVVVNSAGYALFGAIEEATEKELRDQFETNVFGAIAVTRAVLPILRRQRSGHLVQISSLAGVEAFPGISAYSASKFALEGLFEGLSTEVEQFGIKVTIVEPGPFRTEFTGRSATWSERMEEYALVMDPVRASIKEMHGSQSGDPQRAAETIISCVGMNVPPLRLPLGETAFGVIREQLKARLQALDSVEGIGLHTDYDS